MGSLVTEIQPIDEAPTDVEEDEVWPSTNDVEAKMRKCRMKPELQSIAAGTSLPVRR